LIQRVVYEGSFTYGADGTLQSALVASIAEGVAGLTADSSFNWNGTLESATFVRDRYKLAQPTQTYAFNDAFNANEWQNLDSSSTYNSIWASDTPSTEVYFSAMAGGKIP
jgi:hypothetical protein